MHLEIEKRKITSTSFEGGQMLRPSRIDMANTSVQSVSASERKSKSLDAWLNVVLVATAGLGIAVYLFPIFSPELYAPTSTYRFGTVKAGTPIKHTFTLRNLHPWPVTVTGITSDCGCTKAFVGKEPPFRLTPLESVKVEASVETSLKGGQLRQTVRVVTSDNAYGTELHLQGNVQRSNEQPTLPSLRRINSFMI